MRIMFWLFSVLSKLKKNKTGFDKFKPEIFLHDGQGLHEYGFNAKIIHVPGHTKGSIAVLTNQGDLFAGDTLVNYRKPHTAIIVENPDDLRESLEKLKKLNVRKVYPGHGKPFSMEDLKNL